MAILDNFDTLLASMTLRPQLPGAMAIPKMDRIGNCRVLAEIGSGGMAVVYRAVQEPLGREVAIKALKPSIAVDSNFAKRFEREAIFLASLQHENILHVYDFVVLPSTTCIIMEYVKGIDLYDVLEKVSRLPADIAAIIALQLARALDYAHFRGIIHRDIKPANIMLSHQGSVKLMDFGIARDNALSDLTETGTGLGTPSYMSPEQILGDKLDFRSDVFSLGIVLYQMTTGQKPFVEDEGRTVMQKIRMDRPVSARKLNPLVPRTLERIMMRCMEKLPANRYPTTQSLIDELADFLAPRVPINYNARLVLFLRDLGVVSESEANEILASTVHNRGKRTQTERQVFSHIVKAESALLGVLLAGGVGIQAASGAFSDGAARQASAVQHQLLPSSAGYVRFLAEPWASVLVDGQEALTTPSARRIALPAGRHYVRFVNPHFESEEREISVIEGETQTVRVTLRAAE